MSPRTPSRPNTALMQRIASMAAEEAVRKTFTTLGVNISTPEALIDAQEMFSGLRHLQRDWKAFRNRVLAAGTTLLVSIAGAWLMGYIKPPAPPL